MRGVAVGLRDRFRGALLGTFVGDALGMPLEGLHGILRRGTVREMLEARLGRGTYTDDTQLMIALAEALLDVPAGGELDLERVAARFAESFDPARGYGGNTRRILAAIRRGEPWLGAVQARLLPGGSFANGAAMRVAPIALAYYPNPAEVARSAEAQAEVTGHTHLLGRFGARILALAVLRALRRGVEGHPFDFQGFVEEVRETAPAEFAAALDWIVEHRDALPRQAARRLGTGLRAVHSVPVALWAFASRAEDPEEAIVRAVNLGGDADTIGAMTGTLAGAYHGAAALPRRWLEVLEEGETGREYVCRLADRLWERLGLPSEAGSQAP
ncbi:MAG: ADP-ribosylglycohydrolase family protein [Thermoanaerobaculia bacterium]